MVLKVILFIQKYIKVFNIQSVLKLPKNVRDINVRYTMFIIHYYY